MHKYIVLFFLLPDIILAQPKKPTLNGVKSTSLNVKNLQPTISTLAEVRKWTGPQVVGFILTDKGRSGIYLLDEKDKTTPDDGGVTLVTLKKNRYKLQHNGEVSISQFGCLPNDKIDDTENLRRAVASGIPLTVPDGLFLISDSISIVNKGNMRIRGQSSRAIIQMNTDKNLLVFVSTNSHGGTIEISNLTLFAGVNMNFGAAIKVQAGIQRKIGTISNIEISRPDKTKEFKYGIRINNPNEAVLSNIVISGNNTQKLIGVEFTTTMPAVSPTLTNIKVYDALYGFYGRNTSKPGLEGVKFQNCDFVGVQNGIDARNSIDLAQYRPPGFQIQQCHVNASEYGIIIQGYTQIEIASTICYGNGKTTGAGISMSDVTDVNVHDCHIEDVGGSQMYGILFNLGTNRQINVHNNSLRLGNGNRTGIWFGPNTSKSFVVNNAIEGLKGGSPITDQGTSNTIQSNN